MQITSKIQERKNCGFDGRITYVKYIFGYMVIYICVRNTSLHWERREKGRKKIFLKKKRRQI